MTKSWYVTWHYLKMHLCDPKMGVKHVVWSWDGNWWYEEQPSIYHLCCTFQRSKLYGPFAQLCLDFIPSMAIMKNTQRHLYLDLTSSECETKKLSLSGLLQRYASDKDIGMT